MVKVNPFSCGHFASGGKTIACGRKARQLKLSVSSNCPTNKKKHTHTK